MDHTGQVQPLRSTFADDPAYEELIGMFVADLPDRVSSIESAIDGQDADRLRVLAHQLKGAAPGYGFEPIGAAAARVEDAIDGAVDAALESAMKDARELIDLCRSASAGGADPA